MVSHLPFFSLFFFCHCPFLQLFFFQSSFFQFAFESRLMDVFSLHISLCMSAFRRGWAHDEREGSSSWPLLRGNGVEVGDDSHGHVMAFKVYYSFVISAWNGIPHVGWIRGCCLVALQFLFASVDIGLVWLSCWMDAESRSLEQGAWNTALGCAMYVHVHCWQAYE